MGHQNDNEGFGISKCDDNPSDLVFKQLRVFETLRKTNLRTQLSINRWKLSVPYKSELCLLFQRGKCYYGENCHFSHSIGEFGKPGSDTEEDKRTVQERRWFASGISCPYGDNCKYIHVIDSHKLELPMESDAIALHTANLSNNINNNDGMERRSMISDEGCARPSFHMTRLYRRWMKYGKCLYGEQCTYAHGENELKECAWPKHGNVSYQKHRALESRKAPSFSMTRKSMSRYAAPFYNAVNNTANRKKLELQCHSLIKSHIKKLTGIYGDWIDEDDSTIRFD